MKIIKDTFSDNRNGWSIIDDANEFVQIENGSLHLINRTSTNESLVFIPRIFFPEDNFHLIVKLRCISHYPGESFFGLQTRSGSHYCYIENFLLSTNGSYYKINKTSWLDDDEPQEREYRKPIGTTIDTNWINTLELIKKDKYICLIINNNLVFEDPKFDYFELDLAVSIIANPHVEVYVHSIASVIGENLDDLIQGFRNVSGIYENEDSNEPEVYELSDGTITTDYVDWKEDYDQGGFFEDEDYFIYGDFDD